MARENGVRVALGALAVTQLALGLFMGFAPREFFDSLGPWGDFNGHYVRDFASFYGAIGIAALLALSRPVWRAPVFAIAALEYALHSLNHVADLTEADPEWVGYVDLALLVAGTAVLAWLTRTTRVTSSA